MTVHASRPTSTLGSAAVAVGTAFVAAGVLDTVISVAAQGLGADPVLISGLMPVAYLPLTLIGLVAAALVWARVRARARRPVLVMRRLIPIVVILSLVPDVLVGLAGFGWLGAVALMMMHLAVAACGVLALQHFLRLPS